MRDEIVDAEPRRHRPDAALTPRPRRLLLIGRVKPGGEGKVREAQARYPVAAAAAAGIAQVEAFIGSGYYAVWLQIDADDMQEVLAAYVNDSKVREFHASLRPFVAGLPGPEFWYGPSDRFHERSSVAASPEGSPPDVLSSADLPLAASMYRWSAADAS